MAERETVMTMAGAGEVPVMQSLLKAKITPTGVKISARRGPRWCKEVAPGKNTGKCRCKRWIRGTPPAGYKSVMEQCGGKMELKKLR